MDSDSIQRKGESGLAAMEGFRIGIDHLVAFP